MARVTKISSLIDELFNTVEALGVKKTLEVLKNSKQQKVQFNFNTVNISPTISLKKSSPFG